MSSALAMILAAGMTVPGIGPERVSGEIEQGLDLPGDWEGLWWLDGRVEIVRAVSDREVLGGVRMKLGADPGIFFFIYDLTDEGNGRLRGKWNLSGIHGIYQQDGEELVLCLGEITRSRPKSFRADDGQHLLILRRIKPSE
jgi:hypothetical protein